MNIEMILNDQHKKENENIIKELKIQNTFIENKLQQISIFYITNKDKYNYELAKTFIDNLNNFIEIKEITNLQFIKSNNCNLFLETIKNINDMPNDNNIKSWKQSANKLFSSICNEEQDKLINLMHINEKKLKIYENLLDMYLNPDCNSNGDGDGDGDDDDDDNELEIKPEQNISVITNIIFLIMILFIIIVIMVTVFMIDQYHLPYNNNQQCSKFFNKQSKLVI
jgi:hypothetical protein